MEGYLRCMKVADLAIEAQVMLYHVACAIGLHFCEDRRCVRPDPIVSNLYILSIGPIPSIYHSNR